MRFEEMFNSSSLGTKISENLMNDETNKLYVVFYLRDFIYMKYYPPTEDEYNVSYLHI